MNTKENRGRTSKALVLAFSFALNALLGLSAAANAEAGEPKTAEPIKIGFIASLSGIAADQGKRMVDGFQLYLDQVHDRMGGRPVQLIVENDEGAPATALAKLTKLAEKDHCSMVSGVFFSHVMLGISPAAEKYQMPFVCAVAAADDITQRKRNPWVVRTSWGGSQSNYPLGEYAAKKLGYKRIVTVAADYAYGWECVGGVQKAFEENGGQVVQKLWFGMGLKDFTSVLKQIRTDADAVYFCLVGASTEIIPKQYKQLGFKLPIIGSASGFDESFYVRPAEELVGGISSGPYINSLDTPANKKFVAAYSAKYHYAPSFFSECGYTAAAFIDKAIADVKGKVEDKNKLLAALRKVEIKDDPRGPVKIDAYGNPTDNQYIYRQELVNGKLTNKLLATYPMVSQFWHYAPAAVLSQPSFSRDYPPCQHCSK